MGTFVVAVFVSFIAICVIASEKGLFGDVADDRHAWAVHDMNRPRPRQITARFGEPPSDAIVLFDGTQESVDANWCTRDGRPVKWTVKDGAFVCTPKSGPAYTKRPFGDAQFHVEWMISVSDAKRDGQFAGNSGVLPMGKYEIQILNSFDPDPTEKVRRNYPDGIAGAVYGQSPPLVNACLPAGVWQTYDIVFHQPRWKNGVRIYPGAISVFLNGVLVQDNRELEGPTDYRRRRKPVEHAERLPWMLQDHHAPVRFRNIWIREIPSMTANTTDGGPYVDLADVRALRNRTAAALFALVDIERASKDDVKHSLETLAYSTGAKYVNAAKTVCENFRKRTSNGGADGGMSAQDRKDVAGWFNVLRRCHSIDLSAFPLAEEVGIR